MEYVQAVLVQVEADKIDEASRPQGLLAELDEHRSFLERQPGFLDMRVVRSINEEGNILLAVETRWEDDASLVEYETREPTVSSIVNRHQDLIVRGSLQVLDMEALRTEAGRPIDAETEARERLALPLLVPLGVLAFALLVIYGLSRIYLEIPSEAATGLAAAIALGILGTAWYVSSNPNVSAQQIGGIAAVAVAVLVGGAIYALVHEDGGETAAEGTPPPAATEPAEGGAPPAGPAVEMGDNFFTFGGERQPAVQVAAATETTIDLTNGGSAIHNMHIAGVDNEYDTDDDFVSEPSLFRGGDTGSIAFQIDEPGTYDFRCDFHPTEMTGTLEVQ